MAHLAVIGCGYVGTVSAACFARLGHRVDCIDIDAGRIRLLQSGRSPIHEPGLEPLLQEGIRDGRLRFMAGYPDHIEAEFAFIAVNTPGSQEGPADLRAVRDAVSSVASRLAPGAIIVNKSTVPIGTGDLVEGMALRAGNGHISVVSNPEFLREGSAVHDFLHPDRIVLGSNDPQAIERVAALYGKLSPRVQRTDIRTAEMIKYASNAFLATKISFINEMAAICEALGADVEEVARGMGMDERIGPKFLQAGLGWGGSCFPKDVRALAHMAAVHGTNPQLLRSVIDINKDQRLRVVRKLRTALDGLEGRRILILGAAFKPHTDDVRNSPALELAQLLRLEGARVAVHDPVVPAERIQAEAPEVEVVQAVADGAAGAHAIVIATGWPQFHDLSLEALAPLMARRVLLDGRNFFSPEAVRQAGFAYLCVGRPAVEAPEPAFAPPLPPIPVPDALSVGGAGS